MNFHERELPSDEAAERACVGAIVKRPEQMADVQRRLPHGREEFFFPKVADVYEVACEMVGAGKRLDKVTMRAELERRGKLAAIGGVDFVQELCDATPSYERAIEYAELVHSHYLRRRLIGACYDSADRAFNVTVGADESLSFARKSLDGIADLVVADSRSIAEELMDAVCEQAENGTATPAIETHLHDLNQVIGGLTPGELVVIAARPSCGKSALAVNLADYAAYSLGEKVFFLSLEMTGTSVATRILANHASVNSQHIQWGRSLDDAAHQRLREARARLRKRNLIIDDSSGQSISQVVSMFRADWTRRQTAVFVVDYLTLIRADPGYRVERRDILIGEFTSRLKAIAKECNAVVVALAQLNRESVKANRAPNMSDLRESGNIEQDADVILFIHDPDPNEQPVSVEPDGSRQPILTRRRQIIVAKNRNGSIGAGPIDVAWTPAYQRFANLQPGDGAAVLPHSA